MDETPGQAEIEVKIVNPQGLHARPVMRFVDTAAKFKCVIRVKKETLDVDGKSPMEMMLLEATQGTVLRICAEGDDADKAVEALSLLVGSGFGEI